MQSIIIMKKEFEECKKTCIILSFDNDNHRFRVDLKKSKEDCLIPTSL
jgi:hypothetical protein